MIRFAIWSAVSTLEQVDGVSLDNQVNKCRERGKSEGWIDSGLYYVADGYSRTGYVNLSDAEKEIPPLHQMLADMRAGKFDVLIVWNYDRLGDLIVMVATEFRNNKRQLFSLSQPTPVQETYNPYMDDSSFIMQAFAPIWQRQRISELRRKWDAGMPARIKDGLHPNNPPFGYRFVAKDKPHEIVPAEAALVRDMARMLLEGESLKAIARHCQKSGILPHRTKKWSHTIVSVILDNPYYTGMIYWRKVQVVNKRIEQLPMSKRVIAEGKHAPIFTVDEFESITAELKRRREINRRIQIRFPLSGLTFCGKCGRKLLKGVFQNPTRRVLREQGKSCHVYTYETIAQKIADKIQSDSLERRNPRQPEQTKEIDYSSEIKDLEERIERVQQSAEFGVFTPAQALKRVNELQASLEKIEARKREQEQAREAMQAFDESFEELEYMAEWILNDDPKIVNQLLHSVIKRVNLFPDDIKIEWRVSGQ